MAWFIEYILRWQGKASFKAALGNVVHLTLEVLSNIKLKGLPVENKKLGIIDENYTIDHLNRRSFNWHKNNMPEFGDEWNKEAEEQCLLWTNKAIEFKNGMFNPLNLDVVAPEQYFSVPLEYEWAKLDSGYIKLNGFIDLIIKQSDDCYELIDWKTGKRKDWNTGKVKNEETLRDDIQLLIYYYAMHQLFPQVNSFAVTIFYISDGGPYTVYFDKEDLPRLERRIERKVKYLLSTKKPSLNKTFKCRFCDFSKSSFEDAKHIEPIIEFRDGQFTQPGELMSKCQQTEYMLTTRGVDWVTTNMYNIK
jgi:hypothetical protein